MWILSSACLTTPIWYSSGGVKMSFSQKQLRIVAHVTLLGQRHSLRTNAVDFYLGGHLTSLCINQGLSLLMKLAVLVYVICQFLIIAYCSLCRFSLSPKMSRKDIRVQIVVFHCFLVVHLSLFKRFYSLKIMITVSFSSLLVANLTT